MTMENHGKSSCLLGKSTINDHFHPNHTPNSPRFRSSWEVAPGPVADGLQPDPPWRSAARTRAGTCHPGEPVDGFSGIYSWCYGFAYKPWNKCEIYWNPHLPPFDCSNIQVTWPAAPLRTNSWLTRLRGTRNAQATSCEHDVLKTNGPISFRLY